MNNLFTKKNPPPLAAPNSTVEEPLSAMAGAFATRIEKLEEALRVSEEYGRAQNQRAQVAEATLEALKREFEKIRIEQDEEARTIRNQLDHWHDEAVKLRSRIDAIVGPLIDVLHPKPPLAEPPAGLEEAIHAEEESPHE
jgi:hypothetical protein